MDVETARKLMAESGLNIVSEDDLNNGMGVQLRTAQGPILSVYKTGKCVAGGKRQDLLAPVLAADDGRVPVPATRAYGSGQPQPARKVFVVYGHDTTARTEVEAMLRRWDMEPLILDQIPSGGQTIIEKLESVRKDAVFAVVIATPDDEGHEKDHPEKKLLRARQNVVMELGMMLAVLGRPRVAILLKSDLAMEKPSDIQGLIYIPFKESVAEAKLTLAKEMHSQGINIDVSKV